MSNGRGDPGPPARETDLKSALDEHRQWVEAELSRVLPEENVWPENLHRAMRYSLFAGGKRIRPLLVIAASEAVGGSREDTRPLACAVEMIHTYSLIHDDLPAMDDDDLRRGKPTCHRVFGEAMAILAGDALLTHAFQVLAEPPQGWDGVRLERLLRATGELAVACGSEALIGGQVADLEAEGRGVGAAGLERIHRSKTGALLEACVRGGAILGGAAEPQLESVTRYGQSIGLAFQVVDDILDETEASEQLGKTAGKDRTAGKATYVSVHGLEQARATAARLLGEALAAIRSLGQRGWLLEGLARLIVERHG
jgi:geranylgeranyl diphosphate synthase type II